MAALLLALLPVSAALSAPNLFFNISLSPMTPLVTYYTGDNYTTAPVTFPNTNRYVQTGEADGDNPISRNVFGFESLVGTDAYFYGSVGVEAQTGSNVIEFQSLDIAQNVTFPYKSHSDSEVLVADLHWPWKDVKGHFMTPKETTRWNLTGMTVTTGMVTQA